MASSTSPISTERQETSSVPAPPPLPPSNPILDAALQQWLFTDEEMMRTPSIIDGMSLEAEHTSRSKGVNFIVQVGIMLKLPQLTLATASVFLHRFFMRYSMVDLPNRPGMHPYPIAATSLFLATKVEENCRKMRELVVACCRVAQKNPNLVVDEQSKEFWKWRDTILHNEDTLLEALCFDLQLEQPYRLLYDMICFFGVNEHKPLRNAAWAFVNDSMYTVLALQFTPRVIAAAAFYAAAKICDVSFNDDAYGRPWWEQVNVDVSEVRRACNRMAQLYEKQSVHRQTQPYTSLSVEGHALTATTDKTRNSDGIGQRLQAGAETPSRSEGGEGERNGRKRSREPGFEFSQIDGHQSSQTATQTTPSVYRSGSMDTHTERGSQSQNEPLPKRQRTNDNTPEVVEYHPKSPNLSSISQPQPSYAANGARRTPHGTYEYNKDSNTDILRNQNQRFPYSHSHNSRQDQNHQPHDNRNGIDDLDSVQQRIDEIVQGSAGVKDSTALNRDYRNGAYRPSRDNDRNWDWERDRDRDRDRDWDRNRGRDRDNYDHRDRDRYRDRNQERDPESRVDRSHDDRSRYRSPSSSHRHSSHHHHHHRHHHDRMDDNDRANKPLDQEDEGGGGSEEGEL